MKIATDINRYFVTLSKKEAEAVIHALGTSASVALANHDTTLYATLTSARDRMTHIINPNPAHDHPRDAEQAAEVGGDDGWVLANPRYRTDATTPEAEAYRAAYTEAAHDRVWAIMNGRA